MFRSHFFLALFATLPYRGFFFSLSLLITPKVVVCLLVEQKVTLLTRFRLFLSKQWVEGGGRFEQNFLINFLSCSTESVLLREIISLSLLTHKFILQSFPWPLTANAFHINKTFS